MEIRTDCKTRIQIWAVFCLVLSLTAGCRNDLPPSTALKPSDTVLTDTPAAKPDLLVGAVYHQPTAPGTCLPESDLYRYEVQITNVGTGEAGPFTIRVNRSHLPVSQTLPAGQSMLLSVEDRELSLTIEVDSANEVFESDESNNLSHHELSAPTLAANCLMTATPEVELVDPLAVLQGHTAPVSAVAFSPDGNLVASGSVDNTIRLWRVNEKSLLRTMTGHPFPVLQLAFSPDGSMLGTGSTDGIIRIWRVSNGSLVKNLFGHAGWITSLDFSGDGRFLLSSAQDFTVRLWRASDGRMVQTIDEGMSMVNQAVFSPGGTDIAWAETNGTVRIRSLQGSWINLFHGGKGQATSLEYSPDGDMLAAGYEDGAILIWRLSDGILIQTIEAHAARITRLTFSSDERYLAAAAQDGLISLWRSAAGEAPFQLRLIYEGHEGAVNWIAFSPDNHLIASGGDDTSVRLWAVPAD